jgi:heptosyltransferase II
MFGWGSVGQAAETDKAIGPTVELEGLLAVPGSLGASLGLATPNPPVPLGYAPPKPIANATRMPDSPNAVLLIQPAKLGDVLVSSAMLQDLRAAFPAAALDFMVGRAAAPLLDNNPLIRRRLTFTGSVLKDLPGVRSGNYDWVVDPRGTNATAILTRASGAAVRAGFAVRPPRLYAYTHRLPRSGRPAEYSGFERRRLIGMLGVPMLRTLPLLFLTETEVETARARLASLNVALDLPIAGITLAGGTPRREWNAAHYAAATRELESGGMGTVIFIAPGDQERLIHFRDAGGVGIEIPCGLRELLALLSLCSVFISSDTGPAHFAMALGVATVTVYPRGQSAHWNPGMPRTIALESPASILCPECALPRRAIDRATHTCVQAVSAVDATAAVWRLLETRHSPALQP